MITFKSTDDVILNELIDPFNLSRTQLAADRVDKRLYRNSVNNNIKKITEMLFGRITENSPPRVPFNTGAADRVTSHKLLGLIIADNLRTTCTRFVPKLVPVCTFCNYRSFLKCQMGFNISFASIKLHSRDNRIFLQNANVVIVFVCQKVLLVGLANRVWWPPTPNSY